MNNAVRAHCSLFARNAVLWGGVLSLFIAACAPSTRPIVKIGLVAPFEGRYRAIGEEIVYAVRLAVREANERGGINGYSIELMAYDDMGQAALAAEQARKLATDPQVAGVLGHWLEPTTLAAAPVYADSGLPFLATALSPDLDPAAFRFWYTDSTYLAADPDSAHCPLPCDSLEDSGWLNSQLATSHSKLIGPALWGLSQFARLTGAPAEGVRVLAPAPLPSDSADPSFADRYRAVSPGPQPGYFAVLAYDATMVLLAAIDRAIESNNVPTRSGVEAALAQTDYAGLSGTISFDSERDLENWGGWIYARLNGQLVAP